MVLKLLDLDETVKVKVDPDEWEVIIADNYNNLSINEIRYLREGPVEYAIAVLLKLGLIERILH